MGVRGLEGLRGEGVLTFHNPPVVSLKPIDHPFPSAPPYICSTYVYVCMYVQPG